MWYLANVDFGQFLDSNRHVYAGIADGLSRGDRRSVIGGELLRQNRSFRSGKTEHAAAITAAADPQKPRRLSKPSDSNVGQQGARLQMKGKGVGSSTWRVPVWRLAMALVLWIFLGYTCLGDFWPASTLLAKAEVRLRFAAGEEGEPVMDGLSRGDRRSVIGGELLRQNRSFRSGKTEHAAAITAAADQ